MIAQVALREPRLYYCFDAAWDIIRDLDISTFPVNPLELLDKLNIRHSSIGDLCKQTGFSRSEIQESVIKSLDGGTIHVNEESVVIYNERVNTPARIRWTIIHELAHICLNHFEIQKFHDLSDEERRILDREADHVTKEILAPLGLLDILRITDARRIRTLCGLSKTSAEIRAREIKKYRNTRVLKQSRCSAAKQFKSFLTPIRLCKNYDTERRIETMETVENVQFRQNACPRCGLVPNRDMARYCTQCGAPLYNYCGYDPNDSGEPCGHLNMPDAKYCEICGSETILVRLGIYQHWVANEKGQTDPDDVPF